MDSLKFFTDDVIYDMGKRIQSERKKRGFKAIDFADIIGIGKDQLSRIENGKVVCKTEHLYVIAQILQVSVDYIMFGKQAEAINKNAIYLPSTLSSVQKDKLSKIVRILTED